MTRADAVRILQAYDEGRLSLVDRSALVDGVAINLLRAAVHSSTGTVTIGATTMQLFEGER